MKSKLLTMTVAMASVALLGNVAQAQVVAKPQQVIKNVAVNVQLKEVIGVGPNEGAPGSSVVDFVYETANDYNNAKTITVPSQFSVTSSSVYNVVIKSNSAEFVSTEAGKLPLSILKLSARATGSGSFGPAITPTGTDQTLVSAAPAVLAQNYDVLYTIDKNATLLSAPKQLYTANLVFSVTAP